MIQFMHTFLLFFMILIATLSGDERGWNSIELAEAYSLHSEPQKLWAFEQIGLYPFKGNEKILDFGCGDGKITAELAKLVPNGSVTGYDISKDMIQLASAHFPPEIYENLHFQTQEVFDQYDLITSFCVLHFVDNPLNILKELKSHLKPTGTLLLTIPEECIADRQLANELLQKYRIEQPWKRGNYSSSVSIRTLEGCISKLQDAGYTILSISREDSPYSFQSLEEYIEWLVGTASANWGIPLSIGHSFFTEFAREKIALHPELKGQDGHILLMIARIHVIAQ